MQYLCLFKSVRDRNSIGLLGKQLLGNSKLFLEIFDKCVNMRPFGIFWIDLNPSAPDAIRYRATLPYESDQIVFVVQ